MRGDGSAPQELPEPGARTQKSPARGLLQDPGQTLKCARGLGFPMDKMQGEG